MSSCGLSELICTNPPFKNAGAFVAHALKVCPRVIMLLRLAFLESRRRSQIIESGTLARVHVFRERLPRMHRDGWNGPLASSSMSFAWFVWSRDHQGPPTLHRISGVELVRRSHHAPRKYCTEAQIQNNVCEHLRWRAMPGAFWCHVPNGGARSPIEAAIFKGMGVVAGVPDLLIIYDGECFGLELKSERGYLTNIQKETHERRVATAHGIDAALKQLTEWRLLRSARS